MPNSFPMAGRATFTEETMKGVRNEARTATSNAVRFVAASCMIVTTFLFGNGTRRYRGQPHEHTDQCHAGT